MWELWSVSSVSCWEHKARLQRLPSAALSTPVSPNSRTALDSAPFYPFSMVRFKKVSKSNYGYSKMQLISGHVKKLSNKCILNNKAEYYLLMHRLLVSLYCISIVLNVLKLLKRQTLEFREMSREMCNALHRLFFSKFITINLQLMTL